MKLNPLFLKKFNIRIVAIVILLLIVLLEAYIGYSEVYRKLNPQADDSGIKTIIRINRSGFAESTEYLKSLAEYESRIPALLDDNPFRY